MDNMERQRQIESDSVRDGCVRWCQNIDYLQATDTKPCRNLIGISWRSRHPLVDVLRVVETHQIRRASATRIPPHRADLRWVCSQEITIGTLLLVLSSIQ